MKRLAAFAFLPVLVSVALDVGGLLISETLDEGAGFWIERLVSGGVINL